MLPIGWREPGLLGVEEIAASLVLVGLALALDLLVLELLRAGVRSGRYSGLTARTRFHAALPRIITPIGVLIVALALVPFLVDLASSTDSIAIGESIWLLGLGVLVPIGLYDAVLQGWLLPHVRHALMGGAPNPSRAVYILRGLLLRYGPPLAYITAIGILNLSPALDAWRWSLPVGIALIILMRSLVTHHMMTWLSHLMPLEESEWAALAPRVATWTQRAGVKVEGVCVQRVGTMGTASSGVYGIVRHRMYFGASFLAASDWRQRDAVTCHELHHLQRRDTIRHLLINLVSGVLLAASLAYLPVAQLAAVVALLDPARASGIDNFTADHHVFIVALVCYGLYLAWFALTVIHGYMMRRAELDCDHYAALTTGDPLGLEVALLSIEALMGAQRRRAARSHPSNRRRLSALDALRRRPGPFAPWAFAPVPSMVQTIAKGGVHLTVPLEKAPPPPPVPQTPWPVSTPAAPSGLPSAEHDRVGAISGRPSSQQP